MRVDRRRFLLDGGLLPLPRCGPWCCRNGLKKSCSGVEQEAGMRECTCRRAMRQNECSQADLPPALPDIRCMLMLATPDMILPTLYASHKPQQVNVLPN